MVGSVGVGGQNPIRIQSMTITSTRDVEGTIDQIMRLSDAGCDIVRITVQGKGEAICSEAIKNGLIRRGYTIPLVADIHFYPPAAMIVAEFVDKIRINPGNFVDPRAQFKIVEHDPTSDDHEIERIEEKFLPLIELSKKFKRSLRIGANLGSLSDRIMTRYGDTPRGMVESALEYARICRKSDFHDLIFSMKASNPIIMIEAYRLLASEMMRLGWNYPLHLGVTEAGAKEDGRIKSAIGIGALLLDGLGDTIRISLTEDPWHEIDPCRRLIRFVEERSLFGIEPFEEKHREVRRPAASPFHRDGAVIAHSSPSELEFPIVQNKPDAIWMETIPPMPTIHPLRKDTAHKVWLHQNQIPLFDSSSACILSGGLWPHNRPEPEFILFHPTHSPLHETRRLIDDLKMRNLNIPVILCLDYSCSIEDLTIRAAAEAGAILCDRLVEGISILSSHSLEAKTKLSFNILQCARLRMTKTEYISCPGCGRTLFDLQRVARQIREATGHLPGVKIAIMGCIVNGPGEMADADFGLVGSKPGKLDLYFGKTCMKRDIDIADGPRELIELIASQGRWIAN
jgi:(E)-4-hydroxy-3-methylbut-2-enyl-diphosphate synthase